MVGAATLAGDRKELGFWRLLAINTLKFGADGFHWTPVNIILLPTIAILLVGDSAPLLSSKAASAGAVFAVIVPIAVGYLSDRTPGRFGRRRPWILAGTLVNLIGLALMAAAGSPAALIAAYLVIQISNNGAFAAYSAVIPDVVPGRQNGRASGLLNAMQQLGTVVGLLALTVLLGRLGSTRLGASTGAIVVALVVAGSLIVSLAAIPEKPLEKAKQAMRRRVESHMFVAGVAFAAALLALEFVLLAPWSLWTVGIGIAGLVAAVVAVAAGARIPALRGVLVPLQDHDFFWVLATRFFNTVGLYSVGPFIAFFFKDVVRSENYGLESSLWLLAVIGGGVLPAVAGGYLSDRLGGRRKLFVYVSSGVQAAVAAVLLFSLVQDRVPLYLLGFVFGLGFGAYQAVDWALACDVLPDRNNAAAKDMALFHVSFTLPQVLVQAIGGPILVSLNHSPGGNFGYRVLFGSAAIWFVLSTVFVRQIRGVR